MKTVKIRISKRQRSMFAGIVASKDMADRGWESFWSRRGASRPPRVSNRYIGAFELPDGSSTGTQF